jgi:hypothetical protein
MFFVLPIFFLNIFYLCRNFYKINKLKESLIVRFDLQNLYKTQELRLVLRLSHKHITNLFIILYNHYLSKFSKLKNQVSKLKFKI